MPTIWEWRFADYTDEALKLAYHLSKDAGDDDEHHVAARDELARRARARLDKPAASPHPAPS